MIASYAIDAPSFTCVLTGHSHCCSSFCRKATSWLATLWLTTGAKGLPRVGWNFRLYEIRLVPIPFLYEQRQSSFADTRACTFSLFRHRQEYLHESSFS